jgi:predicted nuclease of predicted toxin-antitoxin system
VRFKLDENLPSEVLEDLQAAGHDADSVIEEGLQGATDGVVLDAARAARRVLLTLDKGVPYLVLDNRT